MLLRRPGSARAGALLDARLPWPRQRAVFRSWRRRRPFWAGVLLGAAGTDVLLAPLSPLSVLVNLGLGGLAAIGIGAALILAGAFLILAPHARTYVSLNALLLSVLSFVATNLGGFVLGTALGITGSAMGFGWTPRPAVPAGDTGRASGTEEAAGAGGTGDSPEPSGRALAVVLPLVLTLALVGVGGPRAQAAEADAAPGRVALAPAVVTASRFSPQGFTLAGTTEMTTAKGRFKVIVLRMNAATLTDYRLQSRDPGDAQQELTSNIITMTGHVTLYMKSFSGCIEGIPGPACVTFAPDKLPAPPVVPPFVYMTKVRGEQALITSDALSVDGLGIRMTTRSGSGSAAYGAYPAPGSTDGGTDDGAPADGTTGSGGTAGGGKGGDGAGGSGTSGSGGDGALHVSSPHPASAGVPWCEKVTLTFTNTGGAPVHSGTVDFDTHIVGALGVPWVTQTSHRRLPVPIAPGDSTTKSWKVCVDRKYAGMFLFDRHLEHDVTVHYPGGDPVKVEVPHP